MLETRLPCWLRFTGSDLVSTFSSKWVSIWELCLGQVSNLKLYIYCYTRWLELVCDASCYLGTTFPRMPVSYIFFNLKFTDWYTISKCDINIPPSAVPSCSLHFTRVPKSNVKKSLAPYMNDSQIGKTSFQS